MRTEIIFVHTGDDQEQVGQLFSKYDLLALPVLDTDECMVGIVTVDDALDVVLMKRQRICHSWQQSIRVKNLTLKHRC